jgi:hypothetical protein
LDARRTESIRDREEGRRVPLIDDFFGA